MNYPKPEEPTTLWRMVVPVLSLVHITEEDWTKLTDNNIFLSEGADDVVVSFEPNDLDEWSHYSPEFQSIITSLSKLGYKYVRFSNVGETIPGIKEFDW